MIEDPAAFQADDERSALDAISFGVRAGRTIGRTSRTIGRSGVAAGVGARWVRWRGGDQRARSGGAVLSGCAVMAVSWEKARNRLKHQDRFCTRLGKNHNRFNSGRRTLNQRVQGSSPCAPTISFQCADRVTDLECTGHMGDNFVPIGLSRGLQRSFLSGIDAVDGSSTRGTRVP